MKKALTILKKSLTGLFLSLHTTVVCLVLLCVLVLWGTFFQIDNGIYAAKARFFNSWIVLIAGFIPFPGLRLVGLALILNLFAMLLFKQAWKWNRLGLILIHAGVLILLIGGGIISYTARESYLTLWEGETSNEASSYHSWEIAFWTKGKNAVGLPSPKTRAFSEDTLVAARPYPLSDGNKVFSIDKMYKNCTAFAASGHGDSTGGRPAIDSLAQEPVNSDPDKNVPGAVVIVKSNAASAEAGARYFLYGADPEPCLIVNGPDTLAMVLRPRRISLPLSITLIEFVKEDYSGTQTARQFKSKIRARADAMDREVVISMNKPFRYKQFTFYQSSYDQQGSKKASTFAIVENRGKALPYIASLFMAAGLLLHFLAKLFVQMKKRKAVAS